MARSFFRRIRIGRVKLVVSLVAASILWTLSGATPVVQVATRLQDNRTLPDSVLVYSADQSRAILWNGEIWEQHPERWVKTTPPLPFPVRELHTFCFSPGHSWTVTSRNGRAWEFKVEKWQRIPGSTFARK